MAEQVQRFRQYEYRANSNLVLTTDQHRPRNDEPSGEPETLKDNLGSTRFGDRVHFSKPDIANAGKKRKPSESGPGAKKSSRTNETVLGLTDDIDTYRPRSKETRAAYEDLLSFIAQQMGDQPHDILRGAADETLASLKNDASTDHERKREVESLISGGLLSSEAFAGLVQVGKRITDFSMEEGAGNDKLDDELGVAVVFDEDDDEDDEARQMRDDQDGIVAEDISEDEDADVGLDAAAPRQLNRGDDDGEGGEGEGGGDELPISAIDAYWLQRECGRFFNDPLVAQKMAADVLETLLEADERDCENRLVILLDYDKFELIRLLLKHRYKIAICTKLAQAQSDAERAALVSDFEEGEHTSAVVAQIHAARLKTDEIFTETKQLEARVRKETKQLAKRAAEEEGAGAVEKDLLSAVPEASRARVGMATLDLEALAFEQGGHLMANQKCTLPPGAFRTQRKGYEEVHIPALKPKAFNDDEQLMPIDELPEWAQPAFAGMRTLNRVQSRVHKCALFSAENMLLCAPTGAGKTNVAMLTILHEVGMHLPSYLPWPPPLAALPSSPPLVTRVRWACTACRVARSISTRSRSSTWPR